jgi:hypothetical protein
MAFIAAAAIVGGAAIGGALIESNAASNAAQTQEQGAQNANNIQYQEWLREQQNAAPWISAGTNALSQIQNPKFQQGFTMADFQQSPGYAFDLQQGQQAIERAQAAAGSLNSGGTGKALAQYTQNMANNDYQQAFNNFNTTQNNQYNRLASLAGAGQTANHQLNAAGQNYAGQVGQNTMAAANAQAGATMAQGQIWGNTLSSLGGNVGGMQMLSQMGRGGGGGGGYGSPMAATDANNFGAGSYSMPELGSSAGYGAGASDMGLIAMGG